MMHPLEKKMPRHHEGLAWEERNLTNEFIDVNRMALDDRYGKVGAPLSKRRNGLGPTDGKTPGLFGISGTSSSNSEKMLGAVVIGAIIYFLVKDTPK